MKERMKTGNADSAADTIVCFALQKYADKLHADGKDLEAGIFTIAGILVESNIRLSQITKRLDLLLKSEK